MGSKIDLKIRGLIVAEAERVAATGVVQSINESTNTKDTTSSSTSSSSSTEEERKEKEKIEKENKWKKWVALGSAGVIGGVAVGLTGGKIS